MNTHTNNAKNDHKRQSQPVLSLDFVTALTLEECRARLQHASPVKGQFVSVWDDHSFTVRCCASQDDKINQARARFWGTLEPRTHGTWVWGTSIEESGETPEWPSRRTSTLLLTLILLLAAAWTLSDARLILLSSIIVTGAVAWRFWTWRRRHSEALRVIGWVWETLYVPLKETASDETQKQA